MKDSSRHASRTKVNLISESPDDHLNGLLPRVVDKVVIGDRENEGIYWVWDQGLMFVKL